jgi:GH15 family glucan-1,4-alpha-glucosidase
VSRPVILSNGHILVGLDEHATVHDFYYPYIGLDNLTTARNLNHKVGVWVDGRFSWLDDDGWNIKLDFEDEALISDIIAENTDLNLKLHFKDFVDSHYPVFCRRIGITNGVDREREVRLFMHQSFQISRAGRSDTALYVPKGHYILDYKGWASLLIYGQTQDGQPFDQFSIGNCGIEGKEGTFKDAEDGELMNNLVEHGGVDSVLRLSKKIRAHSEELFDYWVVAADSQHDCELAHQAFLEKGVDTRLQSTRQSFNDWLEQARPVADKIDNNKYRSVFKKSLLLVKSHIDNHGGIIASCDSSIYNYGRDYYSYVWPRDGAYALMPLIELGYRDEPKRFFKFCIDTMDPAGFMKHKYQPDRAIGSTWHPQLHLNHPELPIQEDETAIVIVAIARYLEVTHDEDFIRDIYPTFIKPCVDFMAGFVDRQTNLPHASYDLWEQKFATFTYTVYVTLSALLGAAKIAERFNKIDDRTSWEQAIHQISKGLNLLLNENGEYVKSLLLKDDGSLEVDNTVDASTFYGAFGYENVDKDQLSKSVKLLETKLLNSTPIGGLPRYEHDDYFLSDHSKLGNPWMITTLWLAQYYLANNRREEANHLIDWVIDRASQTGTLAEQVDANTGIGTGVSPLVWSHSTLAETFIKLYGN